MNVSVIFSKALFSQILVLKHHFLEKPSWKPTGSIYFNPNYLNIYIAEKEIYKTKEIRQISYMYVWWAELNNTCKSQISL